MIPKALIDLTNLDIASAQHALTSTVTTLGEESLEKHFDREFNLFSYRYQACSEAFGLSLTELRQLALQGVGYYTALGANYYYGLNGLILPRAYKIKTATYKAQSANCFNLENQKTHNDPREILELLSERRELLRFNEIGYSLPGQTFQVLEGDTPYANKSFFTLTFRPYTNIQNKVFLGLNILELHDAVTRFLSVDAPTAFQDLMQATGTIWPEILHDHLHNIVPFGASTVSDMLHLVPQQQEEYWLRYAAAWSRFKPRGFADPISQENLYEGKGEIQRDNRLAIYEAMLQGINAALFNETEVMASKRAVVAQATLQLFETTKGLKQNHHGKADQAVYNYVADYYNTLAFYLLWHLYREGGEHQKTYDQAFAAAAHGQPQLPRLAVKLTAPDLHARLQLNAHGGYIATKYLGHARRPMIKLNSTIVPLTLAVQRMREEPSFGFKIGQSLIDSFRP